MRLDKLIIGSLKDSPTHHFKNLKNVTIDFDRGHWITVVIGWNGSGKSNVLEALAIIFRDLIDENPPEFAYKLSYRMGSGNNERSIFIDADPDRGKDQYIVYANPIANQNQSEVIQSTFGFDEAEIPSTGKRVRLSTFRSDTGQYLPRYVFGYYSGQNDRLFDVFRDSLKKYDELMRQGKDPGWRNLFYAMPHHSRFVLLSFLDKRLIEKFAEIRDFLETELGLDPKSGVDYVLFVLKQPPWDRNPENRRRAKKERREYTEDLFWGAEGVVRQFLDRLLSLSLAPLKLTRRFNETLWGQGQQREYVYLFIKNGEALDALRGDLSGKYFFKELESLYISELIEEIRIRVRLKNNKGSVTFRELSEGEQQLLAVLGLLRFTGEEESLFLLDEPDTHLNPRWSVNYLEYLEKFMSRDIESQKTSHIVLTTHNPLSIAELVKGQVQILKKNEETREIDVMPPEIDPKGMGYAGIITSDLFGLGSSLDKKTNDDLIELHRLSLKKDLDETDKANLIEIRERLEKLDFNFASRDRLEQEFLRARFDLTKGTEFDDPILTAENKKEALKALVTSLLTTLNREVE